jgi:hypothetical protein
MLLLVMLLLLPVCRSQPCSPSLSSSTSSSSCRCPPSSDHGVASLWYLNATDSVDSRFQHSASLGSLVVLTGSFNGQVTLTMGGCQHEAGRARRRGEGRGGQQKEGRQQDPQQQDPQQQDPRQQDPQQQDPQQQDPQQQDPPQQARFKAREVAGLAIVTEAGRLLWAVVVQSIEGSHTPTRGITTASIAEGGRVVALAGVQDTVSVLEYYEGQFETAQWAVKLEAGMYSVGIAVSPAQPRASPLLWKISEPSWISVRMSALSADCRTLVIVGTVLGGDPVPAGADADLNWRGVASAYPLPDLDAPPSKQPTPVAAWTVEALPATTPTSLWVSVLMAAEIAGDEVWLSGACSEGCVLGGVAVTTPSYGRMDALIARVSLATGEVADAVTMGSDGDDVFLDLTAVGPPGQEAVIAVGTSRGLVRYRGAAVRPSGLGETDLMSVCLNGTDTSKLIWGRIDGGQFGDSLPSLAVLEDGGHQPYGAGSVVLMLGYFEDMARVVSSPAMPEAGSLPLYAAGLVDWLVMAVAVPTGDVLWTKTFGGEGYDAGIFAALATSDALYGDGGKKLYFLAAGLFASTVSFNGGGGAGSGGGDAGDGEPAVDASCTFSAFAGATGAAAVFIEVGDIRPCAPAPPVATCSTLSCHRGSVSMASASLCPGSSPVAAVQLLIGWGGCIMTVFNTSNATSAASSPMLSLATKSPVKELPTSLYLRVLNEEGLASPLSEAAPLVASPIQGFSVAINSDGPQSGVRTTAVALSLTMAFNGGVFFGVMDSGVNCSASDQAGYNSFITGYNITEERATTPQWTLCLYANADVSLRSLNTDSGSDGVLYAGGTAKGDLVLTRGPDVVGVINATVDPVTGQVASTGFLLTLDTRGNLISAEAVRGRQERWSGRMFARNTVEDVEILGQISDGHAGGGGGGGAGASTTQQAQKVAPTRDYFVVGCAMGPAADVLGLSVKSYPGAPSDAPPVSDDERVGYVARFSPLHPETNWAYSVRAGPRSGIFTLANVSSVDSAFWPQQGPQAAMVAIEGYFSNASYLDIGPLRVMSKAVSGLKCGSDPDGDLSTHFVAMLDALTGEPRWAVSMCGAFIYDVSVAVADDGLPVAVVVGSYRHALSVIPGSPPGSPASEPVTPDPSAPSSARSGFVVALGEAPGSTSLQDRVVAVLWYTLIGQNSAFDQLLTAVEIPYPLDGTVVVAGVFQSRVEIDSRFILVSKGAFDIILMELTLAKGSVTWALREGGLGSDLVSSLDIGFRAGLLYGGVFYGAANFNFRAGRTLHGSLLGASFAAIYPRSPYVSPRPVDHVASSVNASHALVAWSSSEGGPLASSYNVFFAEAADLSEFVNIANPSAFPTASEVPVTAAGAWKCPVLTNANLTIRGIPPGQGAAVPLGALRPATAYVVFATGVNSAGESGMGAYDTLVTCPAGWISAYVDGTAPGVCRPCAEGTFLSQWAPGAPAAPSVSGCLTCPQSTRRTSKMGSHSVHDCVCRRGFQAPTCLYCEEGFAGNAVSFASKGSCEPCQELPGILMIWIGAISLVALVLWILTSADFFAPISSLTAITLIQVASLLSNSKPPSERFAFLLFSQRLWFNCLAPRSPIGEAFLSLLVIPPLSALCITILIALAKFLVGWGLAVWTRLFNRPSSGGEKSSKNKNKGANKSKAGALVVPLLEKVELVLPEPEKQQEVEAPPARRLAGKRSRRGEIEEVIMDDSASAFDSKAGRAAAESSGDPGTPELPKGVVPGERDDLFVSRDVNTVMVNVPNTFRGRTSTDYFDLGDTSDTVTVVPPQQQQPQQQQQLQQPQPQPQHLQNASQWFEKTSRRVISAWDWAEHCHHRLLAAIAGYFLVPNLAITFSPFYCSRLPRGMPPGTSTTKLMAVNAPWLECYRDRWFLYAFGVTAMGAATSCLLVFLLLRQLGAMSKCKTCSGLVPGAAFEKASAHGRLRGLSPHMLFSLVHVCFLVAAVGLSTVGRTLTHPGKVQLGFLLIATLLYVTGLLTLRSFRSFSLRYLLALLLAIYAALVVLPSLRKSAAGLTEDPYSVELGGPGSDRDGALRSAEVAITVGYMLMLGSVLAFIASRVVRILLDVRQGVSLHRSDASRRDFPFSLAPSITQLMSPSSRIPGSLACTVSIESEAEIENYPAALRAVVRLVQAEVARGPRGAPSLLRATRVTIVYNPVLERAFRDRYKLLSNKARKVLVRPWPSDGRAVHRAIVLQGLENMAKRLEPYFAEVASELQGGGDSGGSGGGGGGGGGGGVGGGGHGGAPRPPAVLGADPHLELVFHGSSGGEQSLFNICKLGFLNLSLLNTGYYGRGIYSTPSPIYALWYATQGGRNRASVTDRSELCVLMAWALLGQVYPALNRMDRRAQIDPATGIVVRPEDPDHVYHGGWPGADSHVAQTTRGGFPAKDPHEFDFIEVVTSQEASLLPRFIVYVDRDSAMAPLDWASTWSSEGHDD